MNSFGGNDDQIGSHCQGNKNHEPETRGKPQLMPNYVWHTCVLWNNEFPHYWSKRIFSLSLWLNMARSVWMEADRWLYYFNNIPIQLLSMLDSDTTKDAFCVSTVFYWKLELPRVISWSVIFSFALMRALWCFVCTVRGK